MQAVQWFAYGITNVSLAFNRLINLAAPDYARILYGGHRTWFWIAGALLFGLAFGGVLFTPPADLLYHSGMGYAVFGTKEGDFGLTMCRFYNFFVAGALPLAYVGVWLALRRRTSGAQTRALSRKKRSVLTQSLLISMMTTTAAISYVTLPYWPIENPRHFVVVTFVWQLAQGGNCLVYLALNSTIRNGVLKLFKRSAARPASSSQKLTATGTPETPLLVQPEPRCSKVEEEQASSSSGFDEFEPLPVEPQRCVSSATALLTPKPLHARVIDVILRTKSTVNMNSADEHCDDTFL